MSLFTLAQAMDWIGAGRLAGDPATAVERVHTDTRSLQRGDLFIALKGERFDANDLIAQAWDRGAAAAIAQPGRLPAGMPGIEVDDTRLALGRLAAQWRARFSLPLIAVTGSNGKTTVTQMIASILAAWRGADMLATQGNLNNEIGVPLTLLRLRENHRVAVLELGMNHVGEIAYLANLARPTVALVNNAQREHQEFLDGVEAVARENGSVFEALGDKGVAVFPASDAFTALWAQLAGRRPHFTFNGVESDAGGAAHGHPGGDADIVLADARWGAARWHVDVRTPCGPLSYELHIAGRHNLRNSLAAVTCALAVGVPLAAIASGLEAFRPVKGRSRSLAMMREGHAFTLVDDSYNANPDSVHAAIEVLAELPGPHLLVLGDMGEVGEQGPKFHVDVGTHARARNIEQLFTLGDQSMAMGGRHFDDIAALNAAVQAELSSVGSVLVKGSRFMKMERVVEAIATNCQRDEEVEHAA